MREPGIIRQSPVSDNTHWGVLKSHVLRHGRARTTIVTIALALALAAALIGTVLYIHTTTDVPMGTLTRDPLSGKPAHLGLLSQAGILVWAAGAAVCLLAAAVLQGAPGGRFMLAAGVLSLALCVDDAFLLHDEVLPLLGIPEELIYGVYLGMIVLFLVAFRRPIIESGHGVLVLALAFLGLSVVCDAWGLPWLDPYLLEDGAKFTGIALWAAYFFGTAWSLLGARHRPGAELMRGSEALRA